MFKFLSKSRNDNKLVFNPKDVFDGVLLYNSDIILTTPPTKPLYNFDRFNVFLKNIDNKIIDSVRVIKYGIEAEMYVLSIFYDGNKITLIDDSTKSTSPNASNMLRIYTGNRIYKRVNDREITYYLETNDNKKLPIFSLRDINKKS